MEAAARAVDPRAKVWRSSHGDRLEGITILGTPVGRAEFVERELAKIFLTASYSPESEKHAVRMVVVAPL